MEELDDILTPKEIAEYMKVKDRTVRKWINEARLEAAKIGNRWRIEKEDLEQFIQDRK